MEPAQVCDYELLDFAGELETERLYIRVSVLLVGLGDEEHGVWQQDLQVIPERSHILATGLEAMDEDE